MLELFELRELFERLGTPPAGRRLVEEARRTAPVRQVRSNSNNVITRYASRKMARLIDTESRTVEYPAVIQYEHDPDVLEYYAQPMALDIWWQEPGKTKPSKLQHTPDFLLIRRDGFCVEEWREEGRLQRLSAKQPGRFIKDGEEWHSPPVEDYLRERGIVYRLRSALEHPRVYIQNLIFLSNYLDPSYPALERSNLEGLRIHLAEQASMPLLHLLHRGRSEVREGTVEIRYTTDDVYKAIADGELIFDLNHDLLSETHRVMVYRDRAALELCRSLEDGGPHEGGRLTARRDAAIEAGAKVDYDGRTYSIARVGQETATLQNGGESFDLSIAALVRLHREGKVLIHSTQHSRPDPAEAVRLLPPKAIEEILERMKWLEQAKASPDLIPRSKRTLRRYRAMTRNAGESLAEQRLALTSRVSDRGNRTRRIPQRMLEIIAEVARGKFNTPQNISKAAAYKFFQIACHEEDLRPCSMKRFSQELESLRSVRAQKGKRMAYQQAPIVWYLRLEESIHGVRPFQYVHIDHTQLDLLLVSSETRKSLGKPWLTLAVDTESRDIAGFYLSFDPPSYRSCMMVLRDIVKRHGQMPEMLVLDNGKEFHSRALARVCELYGCSLRYRPGGQPRYGSVMERIFGTTNTQFIHLLEGNTKLLKSPRSLTKSVLPENFAAWTLAQLHGALEYQFYTLYGATEHPAHGDAPSEHFRNRMLETGERRNRLVRDDETFGSRLARRPRTETHGRSKASGGSRSATSGSGMTFWLSPSSGIRNWRFGWTRGIQVRPTYSPRTNGLLAAPRWLLF